MLALISPPVVDPRSTYLGSAILSGHLSRFQVDHTTRDANLDFFDWLFTQKTAEGYANASNDALLRYLSLELEPAKAILKGNGFFDVQSRNKARNVLDLYCRALSVVFPDMDLRLHRFSYGGIERSAKLLSDALRSEKPNIFHDYYEYFLRTAQSDLEERVAVSITNSDQLFPGLMLGKYLKDRGHEVAVGGACVTKLREHFLSKNSFSDCFDVAVFFEGEEAIIKFALSGTTAFETTGWANFVVHQGRDTISSSYGKSLKPSSWASPKFSNSETKKALRPKNVLPILTSKGCSWGQCTFCTIPESSGAGPELVRNAVLQNSVSCIERLQRDNDCSNFIVVDENFPASRQVQFSEYLSSKKVCVNWLAYARFEREFTNENCLTIRKAGCRKLLIGLETTSNRVLKLMKKGVTRKIIEANLTAFRKSGIAVHLYGMVGFPGQKLSEAIETLEFVIQWLRSSENALDSASFSEFNLNTSSPIGRDPASYNLIISSDRNDDIISSTYHEADGSEVTDWVEFRKVANERIVSEFGERSMVGWEEYSLLLADRCDDKFRNFEARPRLTVSTLENHDIRRHEVRSFETCKHHKQGYLLLNDETSQSMFVSRALQGMLDHTPTHGSAASLFQRAQAAYPNLTEEAFAHIMNGLARNGIVAITHRTQN
ncbi:B12-binding domain-containing radical SAM protein [Dinoroseobacter sp. S375]|uniref:B12-binding domain-containing radical SAM protein n=1 Tax=Dinoroseobacter sp. S375 TaxID=3415136 RepID=UPI003C7C2437